jgi:aspartate aminotransferase
MIADKVMKLGESETLAMAKKANELKAKGFDIINLTLGEPDFFTPDFVKEEAKKSIDANYSFYTPVAGYLDLRETISQKLKIENGLNYSAQQIVVSTGAKQSIANVLIALLNPGDEVILPAPFWVSYKEIIEFAGGVAKIIDGPIDQEYKITPQQLENAIGKKTKAFIFSNPSNPTGSVYTKKELEAFARILTQHPIITISDEIYEYICFTDDVCSIGVFPGMLEKTVVVNGVSKAFAMTGWRLGYLAAPLEIAKACDKIQSQFTSGASSISQRAAKMAISQGKNHASVQEMKAAFLKRRNCLYDALKKIPGVKLPLPEGAFYLFPDMSFYLGKKFQGMEIKTSKDLAMYLLEHAHVGLTAGMAFGAPECLRFSYALNESKLLEAAQRLKLALEKLV